VDMKQFGSHSKDFHKIRYLEDFFFENLSIKFKLHSNVTRITGTLREDLKLGPGVA
jgi:hypothetical protein